MEPIEFTNAKSNSSSVSRIVIMESMIEGSELLNVIVDLPENKKCFDCSYASNAPRYMCANFSTLVCSCCAILHMDFGHIIKPLSVFVLSLSEIYLLRDIGNKIAAGKWLARWRSDLREPDPTIPSYREEAKEYIKAKYVEKRWVKLAPSIPINPGSRSNSDDSREAPLHQQHDEKMTPVLSSPFATSPFSGQSTPQQAQYSTPPAFATEPYIGSHHPFEELTATSESQFPFSNLSPSYNKPLPHHPFEDSKDKSFALQSEVIARSHSEGSDGQQQQSHLTGMIRSSSDNSICNSDLRTPDSYKGCPSCGLVFEKSELLLHKWKEHGIVSKMAELLMLPKKIQVSKLQS